MTSEATLFVSIASYRDPELIPTLRNMIEEAENPARLHIAVCWQDDCDIKPFLDAGFSLLTPFQHNETECFRFGYRQAQIEVLPVHYYTSQGACWARYQVEARYQQEDYFLQIDSHCRFAPQWESTMIEILESLRGQSKWPVLSTYPPGYVPGENEDRKQHVSRLIFNGFNNNGILRLTATRYNNPEPKRCGYLAAGFVFADGHFVSNVPNDPQIFFMGEEITMAARAWTSGYDFWTPHKLMVWHYYARKSSPKVWGDHSNQAKTDGLVDKAWWEHDLVARERIASVLQTTDKPVDVGKWKLGTRRSLQDYQYHLGVDFREKRVHPALVSGEKESWFNELPKSHEHWLQSLQHINEKLLRLKRDEIDFNRNDVDWWHVGIYDKNNTAVKVFQYSTKEIKAQVKELDDKHIELKVRFITPLSVDTNNIRICPYLTDNGWGDVLEKPW